VEPETKALTALEYKFVDASVKQHAALQDFYAGRTDADGALKAIVATLPDHNKLEEYVERGSDAVETNKKVAEQQLYISELGEHITHMNEEIAELKAKNENLRQRLEAISAVSEHLRDETITATLAGEPDQGSASKTLTAYLQTVADRILPPNMTVRQPPKSIFGAYENVNATVALVGRAHRIEIGDWLELKDEEHTTPALCKCTGVGEYMERRKYKEWLGGNWGKEYVIVNEHAYTVITEESSRQLAPAAFSVEPSKEAL
jgi:hypothetical protein